MKIIDLFHLHRGVHKSFSFNKCVLSIRRSLFSQALVVVIGKKENSLGVAMRHVVDALPEMVS